MKAKNPGLCGIHCSDVARRVKAKKGFSEGVTLDGGLKRGGGQPGRGSWRQRGGRVLRMRGTVHTEPLMYHRASSREETQEG